MIAITDLKKEVYHLMQKHGVNEYAFIDMDEWVLDRKIRHVCENYCPNYDKMWCCPPNVGDIDENINRCKAFQHSLIFSKMTFSDKGDFESRMDDAKKMTNKALYGFPEEMEALTGFPVKMLQPACALCKTCAYPDEPCRFPHLVNPTVESHGLIVRPVLERYRFDRYVGEDGMMFFGMLMFNLPEDTVLTDQKKTTLRSFEHIPAEGETFAHHLADNGLCHRFSKLAKVPFEPGVYPLNGATRDSICVLTSNFTVTGTLVKNEIEKSGIPANLLIINGNNHPLLFAWEENLISTDAIRDFIQQEEKYLDSRTLLIPGKVKILLPELSKALPNWKILTSSDEVINLASDLEKAVSTSFA